MSSNSRNGMSCSDAGKLGAAASARYQAAIKKQNVDEYMQHPVLCKTCGQIIDYNHRRNRFCSHSCAATYSNTGKRKVPDKYCDYCGKLIDRAKRDRGNRFCSMQCSANFMHEKRLKELEEYIAKTGEFPKGNGAVTSFEANRPMVKRYLVSKFGHKCSICGNTEWRGQPIPLIVDHIDGNASNCKVENFRLVCGNCDMQLDTYKGKNFGQGRAWRKKYY